LAKPAIGSIVNLIELRSCERAGELSTDLLATSSRTEPLTIESALQLLRSIGRGRSAADAADALGADPACAEELSRAVTNVGDQMHLTPKSGEEASRSAHEFVARVTVSGWSRLYELARTSQERCASEKTEEKRIGNVGPSDVVEMIGATRQILMWKGLLEQRYAETGTKQRQVAEFTYAANTWDRERRIVMRLEFGTQGNKPRFVVTNLGLPADKLYDDLYCQRGEAENRIKETQLDLFGTRASSYRFLANWLRVMFAALAYTLMHRLRAIALANTELARATAATIRVKLLKTGAAVIRNTRRVRILFASHHPMRDTFLTAAQALAP
jgi:hypothetical protein